MRDDNIDYDLMAEDQPTMRGRARALHFCGDCGKREELCECNEEQEVGEDVISRMTRSFMLNDGLDYPQAHARAIAHYESECGE